MMLMMIMYTIIILFDEVLSWGLFYCFFSSFLVVDIYFFWASLKWLFQWWFFYIFVWLWLGISLSKTRIISYLILSKLILLDKKWSIPYFSIDINHLILIIFTFFYILFSKLFNFGRYLFM